MDMPAGHHERILLQDGCKPATICARGTTGLRPYMGMTVQHTSAGNQMDYRLLGPLEVRDHGRSLALGGEKQRAVLAILMLHRNEVISADQLVDELWGESPPASGPRTVQAHISRLRKALDGHESVLLTKGHGYVLQLAPGELDLDCFRALAGRGRQMLTAGQTENAASILREALALWRGPPLADFSFTSFAGAAISHLEELHIEVVEDRIDADLACGRARELVGELKQWVEANPFRERLCEQLMLALYLSGRQAEALDAYRRARTRLSEELGLEPGPRLRALQAQILNQDPSLTPTERAQVQPTAVPNGDAETLVEREADLRALGSLLDSVRAGGAGRLVLVAGEAGIGKTALVRSFCDRQTESVRVLWGACEPLLTPRPLGAIVEVAETTGGAVKQAVDAGDRAYDVAGALVNELRTWIPTVLVLEDLHWADEATLDVLRLLARRVGSAPALVVTTFRDDELDRTRQLRIVLGELPGGHGRLNVAPLSLRGVTELARSSGVDASELHKTTSGNPFFVTEVLAAGAERIPETVRDAVLARAMRLSEPAGALLQAMAVIPGTAELWLLSAVAGELVGHVDECLASGMLIEVDSGVAFRHELARLAVERSVGPARRHSLYRACLTALAAPPSGAPDPGRLAHHAEAITDREAVLRWAPEAAVAAAASGAHREAEAHYGQALRFADDMSAENQAWLLERRAAECFAISEFDRAIASLENALAIRRELGDRLRIGDALSSLAQIVLKCGRSLDAQASAIEAVNLLEPLGPTRELARGYATRAQIAMVLDDLDDSLAWGASAIELADRLGDVEILAHALDSVGVAMLSFDLPGGSEKVERSLRLAQEAGLDGEAGRAFCNLACAAPALKDYLRAERYLKEGIAYCDDRGLDMNSRQLRILEALVDLGRGRWDQAVDKGMRLLQDPIRTPHLRQSVLQTLGLVRARRGEPGAWEALDEALTLATSTGELQSFGPIVASRAEALWLENRDEDIDDETRATFELALSKKQPWYLGELAYWRWRAGLHDELPAGALARPYALSMTGDGRRAAEEWRKRGGVYEAALALCDGDDTDAVGQAIVELRGLGALRAAEMVARSH